MVNTNSIDGNTSLVKLTWPIFIELVLQILVSNVDQIMISRVSENAVAAIGNVNQIMNVLVITFSVVTMAATILVSQYLGSKRYDKISEIYSVAVFSNLGFSIIVSLILFVFGHSIFRLVQLPEELMGDAMIYMSIIGAGLFLQAIFMTYSAIFRANGLMKHGMYVSVLVNVLNIVGNFILIYGLFGLPKMGIAGVAISSVVSRFIGVIVIIYLFKKEVEGKVSLSYLKPFPLATFKRLMIIGLPSGGESISYNTSQMVILAFVNTMGTEVIAARSYINIIVWFTYLYGSAVSQGNQIRVGYLIGAKEEDKAYKVVLNTLKSANIITVIVGILIWIFSRQFLGIFTANEAIFTLGKRVLFIDLILEIGRCFNMVFVRAMQAAGDIKFPVSLGIISMWFIATVFSYVFGIKLHWGLEGVWIAMAMDELFRAVVFFIRWKRGSWRSKKLI